MRSRHAQRCVEQPLPSQLSCVWWEKNDSFHLRHLWWLHRPIVIYRHLFYRNTVHWLLNLMSISAISGKIQSLATNIYRASLWKLANGHSLRKNTEILVSHRSWSCQLGPVQCDATKYQDTIQRCSCSEPRKASQKRAWSLFHGSTRNESKDRLVTAKVRYFVPGIARAVHKHRA
jgi:hypothetical protein